MATVQRKRLGEILISLGVLKSEDLNRALEVQKKEGGLIGQVLTRLRMVTEEDIVVALATQYNYPYMDVENFVVNPDAVKMIGKELVLRYTFLPVEKMNNILTVVMSDPSNEDALKEIQAASGCRVQAFVGTVSQIENAIKKQYKITSLESEKTSEEKVKMSLKGVAGEAARGKV